MNRLYRVRLLIKTLPWYSAIKCIGGLLRIRLQLKFFDFTIKYYKYNLPRYAHIRDSHIESDLQVVLELAAGDIYRLSSLTWKPDIVIDGGGNIGLFTLAASALWTEAQFICYEPVPENVKVIKKNILLNKLENRVKTVSAALGGNNRQETFYLREAIQSSFKSTIDFDKAIKVDVLRLSEIYSKLKPKKILIKLDIEGAEFEVLEDFFTAVSPSQIIILMEVHGNHFIQDKLLKQAQKSGFSGIFWDKGEDRCHLALVSRDINIEMVGLNN
ncbi:MAG: FkbM family methyltransferase [Spirosomataceae bacterium]